MCRSYFPTAATARRPCIVRILRSRRLSSLGILRSAEKLLNAEPIDEFSIEAVAREAHASKPTIYKWWGSKEKLIGEVYLNLTPLDPDATNLSSAQQELQKVWERLWKIWSNPKWATVSRQLFMASQDDPEALSRYRDGYLRERNKPLAAIIERGVARGELASNLDVELVVDLIAGFSLFRLLMEKPVDVATSQKILSILFGGLSKVPPAVKRNR